MAKRAVSVTSAIVILCISAVGIALIFTWTQVQAQAQVPRSPEALVDRLMLALNTKNPELLTGIYYGIYLWNPCNEFEELLANALTGKMLVLQQLEKSVAAITVPPRRVETVSSSGRTSLVFGFSWSYRVQTEDGISSADGLFFTVSWEVKDYGEFGFRVVRQRTAPCL